MKSLLVALHDQATKLQYPESLESDVELLFAGRAGEAPARSGRIITVWESGSGRYALEGGGGSDRVENLSHHELLAVLLERLTGSLIEELDTAVALHAASVTWAGKSILFPGPTGAGKTSLAAWFAANGFAFLSDELVVLSRSSGATLAYPRPLLARSSGSELLAILAQQKDCRAIRTAANVMVRYDDQFDAAGREREAALIIFPRFVAETELELAWVSPAMAGLKLMECNLNARNIDDGGLRTVTEFARTVPALSLTYGSYRQLDGVVDAFAKFAVDGGVVPARLQQFVAAFRSRVPPIDYDERKPVDPHSAGGGATGRDGRAQLLAEPRGLAADRSQATIPERQSLPAEANPKLTIGMATYDDYDGVYFTLQAMRLYHPEILNEVEFVVIDNHPAGVCAQSLKELANWIPNYRYVAKGDVSGTAVRDWVFREARGEFVLCVDCHILIVPGALKRLISYFSAKPETGDLLQGPMIYDDLKAFSTHFRPTWQAGMYGTWESNPAGENPDYPPFEIPMQGLGLFACRRAAWPGFNPHFRGFGGEEGYIHEKFRQRGGKVLCLPFLRWMHRFNRPLGTHYTNMWEDRVQNYLIGFRELGLDTQQVVDHFSAFLGEEVWRAVVAKLPPNVLPPTASKPVELASADARNENENGSSRPADGRPNTALHHGAVDPL